MLDLLMILGVPLLLGISALMIQLKEFDENILSRDTIDGIDYSTLDDIVYRAAFDKLSKDEYKKLVGNFASHKGIQRAVSNHYVRDAENP